MKTQIKNRFVVPRTLLSLLQLRTCLVLLVTFSLVACSGSGSDEAAPPNTNNNTNTPGIVDDGLLPGTESPTAKFEVVPASGRLPLTVQFFDVSENGSEEITNWYWDFGDGNTSNEQRPTHTYENAGSFAVSLTVSNSVDSSNILEPASVTVEAAQENIIVANGGLSELPIPEQWGDDLPEYSQEILVDSEKLKQFSPLLTKMKLTVWESEIVDGTCEKGFGIANYPDELNSNTATTTDWYSYNPIPSTLNFHIVPLNPTQFDRYEGKITGVIDSLALSSNGTPHVLVGFDKETNKTTNVTAKSIRWVDDHTMHLRARWETCRYKEINLSALVREDYQTIYTLSYPIPIKHWPVMQHYTGWKKVKDSERRLLDNTKITVTTTKESGIEITEAESFEKSLSVSAEAEYGVLSGSVTGTIATAYSNSVTTSFNVSEEVSEEVDGAENPGYDLHYSQWAKIDIFRIEGARGEAWNDENYELSDKNVFEIEVPTGTVATQKIWFLKP